MAKGHVFLGKCKCECTGRDREAKVMDVSYSDSSEPQGSNYDVDRINCSKFG